MLAVCVTFRLKEGASKTFLPLMIQQAQNSRDLERDCLRFDVCASDDEQTVFLYELYTDRAAFGLHLTSSHFLAFDAEVKDLVAEKTVTTYTRLAP